MAMRAGFNLHHSDLQEFLSAPVWDEKSGTPLSILSAMARLGMDPWGEAARLAEMPRAGAAAALAAILARLPRSEPELPDYFRISERLVQFLPEGGSRPAPDAQGASGSNAAGGMTSTQNIGLIVVAAVVAVFLQVNGWLF
ncbi:hypothetical protein GGE65_005192 [Skermanella aerolata]|uniref:Uncharacterized protein n=1 Tax=Skermanella aerolata TaxID=393310 RepID=A0A512DLQ5_9PROT|nr:hypothetical protein [Skermanella aerolata]KJB96445.1 hypothetical protein N826_35190 [Skermanella aerolata KACC 11604]GEO37395.1 hypothetical protein SAE02_15430 [Skermanella aerolata]